MSAQLVTAAGHMSTTKHVKKWKRILTVQSKLYSLKAFQRGQMQNVL